MREASKEELLERIEELEKENSILESTCDIYREAYALGHDFKWIVEKLEKLEDE